MTTTETEDLDPHHQLLIDTKSLLHVSSTGTAPRLLQAFWDNPGSSQYLVGFFVPYSRTQQHGFLGHPPEGSYISEEVACDMAMASYIRASEHKAMASLDGDPVGLGVTSSVASSRPHKGELRAHMVLVTKDTVLYRKVVLEPAVGKKARQEHDSIVTKEAIEMLLEGLQGKSPNPRFRAMCLERFYRYPVFFTDGTRTASSKNPGVYVPATLNPIHEGHRAMCKAIEGELRGNTKARVRVTYLVSSVSPHKGELSLQEMLFKAGMLRAERWKGESRAVEFTHDEPLYLDKAKARPGSIFVIGADTMQRMLDPEWGVEIEPMLDELRKLDVLFYVMGRLVEDQFVDCRDIKLPFLHQLLFRPLGGRVDVSSTEMREDST